MCLSNLLPCYVHSHTISHSPHYPILRIRCVLMPAAGIKYHAIKQQRSKPFCLENQLVESNHDKINLEYCLSSMLWFDVPFFLCLVWVVLR